ncbi:MAG: YchF/TatD family DNA exonuclease, partial [Deltaproteobacteria bacterium]|nr:YchF/TatD family DNA exonuclease [Deltaproteobacteria bacterium]
MLIDTHAHISFPDYEGEEEVVLDRARAAGVAYLINVGLTEKGRDPATAVALAHKHPFVFATVGIHPHDAATATPEAMAHIEKLAADERVVAIGEVGLDFFYEHSPKEIQKECLRQFIRMAKRLKLPLVIHCRDAFDDLKKIFEEEEAKKVGGVLHCYTGDETFARWAIKNNFLISFSGIITFKKTEPLQKVAAVLPDDKILIETDCPFLSPEPFRGKKNEPAYIRYTAQKLAELRGVTLEDIERITSRNAKELFGLPIELPDDKPKIAYRIRNNLYLNITNQCTLACVFCPKFDDWLVKGHFLQLDHEPTAEEIFKTVEGAMQSFSIHELVFCGYGESTLRLDLLKQVASWAKEKKLRVRLDTEGLGNLVHGKNIVPELAPLLDAISVSLNAPDPKTYVKLCPNKFGEAAYPAVKEFIKECKKLIPDVTASVVALPNLDIDLCRQIIEKELGVTFRVRPYDEVG